MIETEIILHQTGPKILSDDYRKCKEIWTKDNDFIYKFYNDHDLELLVKKVFPDKYNFFKKLRKIEKIDFSRYIMMYYNGGIYSDMDIILLDTHNLKKIILEKKKEDFIIVGIEHNKLRYHAAQAILISTPGNKIWLDFINYIELNYKEEKYITYNTGPDIFTSFLKKNKNKYNIYFDEKLLKKYTKHIKTGVWRKDEFKTLDKSCLLCNRQPFICNCFNHKWYLYDCILYYNYKILLMCFLLFSFINILYFIFYLL